MAGFPDGLVEMLRAAFPHDAALSYLYRIQGAFQM